MPGQKDLVGRTIVVVHVLQSARASVNVFLGLRSPHGLKLSRESQELVGNFSRQGTNISKWESPGPSSSPKNKPKVLINDEKSTWDFLLSEPGCKISSNVKNPGSFPSRDHHVEAKPHSSVHRASLLGCHVKPLPKSLFHVL